MKKVGLSNMTYIIDNKAGTREDSIVQIRGLKYNEKFGTSEEYTYEIEWFGVVKNTTDKLYHRCKEHYTFEEAFEYLIKRGRQNKGESFILFGSLKNSSYRTILTYKVNENEQYLSGRTSRHILFRSDKEGNIERALNSVTNLNNLEKKMKPLQTRESIYKELLDLNVGEVKIAKVSKKDKKDVLKALTKGYKNIAREVDVFKIVKVGALTVQREEDMKTLKGWSGDYKRSDYREDSKIRVIERHRNDSRLLEVLYHEFGHHIFNHYENAKPNYHQSVLDEKQGVLYDLDKFLNNLGSIREIRALAESRKSIPLYKQWENGLSKRDNYKLSPTEIFARLFSEYMVQKYHKEDVDFAHVLNRMEFTDKEIEYFGRFLPKLLKEAYKIKEELDNYKPFKYNW